MKIENTVKIMKEIHSEDVAGYVYKCLNSFPKNKISKKCNEMLEK